MAWAMLHVPNLHLETRIFLFFLFITGLCLLNILLCWSCDLISMKCVLNTDASKKIGQLVNLSKSVWNVNVINYIVWFFTQCDTFHVFISVNYEECGLPIKQKSYVVTETITTQTTDLTFVQQSMAPFMRKASKNKIITKSCLSTKCHIQIFWCEVKQKENIKATVNNLSLRGL